MCLGIPMRIQTIDGLSAVCEAGGIRRSVSLFLLQHEPLTVGDHVVVHVGYALQKLTCEEASTTQALLDEMWDGMER